MNLLFFLKEMKMLLIQKGMLFFPSWLSHLLFFFCLFLHFSQGLPDGFH